MCACVLCLNVHMCVLRACVMCVSDVLSVSVCVTQYNTQHGTYTILLTWQVRTMIRYKYLDCSVPVEPDPIVTGEVSSSILSLRNDIATGPNVSSTPKKLECSIQYNMYTHYSTSIVIMYGNSNMLICYSFMYVHIVIQWLIK